VREDKQLAWGPVGEQGREATEHIGNLLLVTAENRDTIADEIEIFLAGSIASTDRGLAGLAAELALSLTSCLHGIENRRQVTSDVSEYWDGISNKIVNAMLSRVLEIARDNWYVATRCYWRDLMSLSDAIEVFGIPFLVASARSSALGHIWFYPPGYSLLDSVLGLEWKATESRDERMNKALELEALAELFLLTPVPWLLEKHTYGPPRRWLFGMRRDREEANPDVLELSADANFAIVCMLAVDWERANRRNQRENGERFLREEHRIPEDVKAVLFGRLTDAKDDALKALGNFGFNSAQEEFLRRWLNREFDLVQARGPKRRRRAIQAKTPR
jgi:hypothetical protein